MPGGPSLHSFAVGLERRLPTSEPPAKVADHIGTVHHEIHYTVAGGARRPPRRDLPHRDLRRDDRARLHPDVPAWPASSKVDGRSRWCSVRRGCRRRFSAATSTFHKAPDARAFHEETVRKIGRNCIMYDCLRANKSPRGVGDRRPRAVPRHGVPRRGHAHRTPKPKRRPATDASRKWILREGVRRPPCRRRSPGARRSSSPTAWATAG